MSIDKFVFIDWSSFLLPAPFTMSGRPTTVYDPCTYQILIAVPPKPKFVPKIC